MVHFWSHINNFYRVFHVQMLVANNLILHTLIDDSLIMKTFAQLVFENNAFIVNSKLLK